MMYHQDGETPPMNPQYCFVFGSNEAGIHGAGASLEARENYGAKLGVGFGRVGRSFAIPTMDFEITPLPLEKIAAYIEAFKAYATDNQDMTFFVTALGTGLCGYYAWQIAPMFMGSPNNCSFPEHWREYLR